MKSNNQHNTAIPLHQNYAAAISSTHMTSLSPGILVYKSQGKSVRFRICVPLAAAATRPRPPRAFIIKVSVGALIIQIMRNFLFPIEMMMKQRGQPLYSRHPLLHARLYCGCEYCCYLFWCNEVIRLTHLQILRRHSKFCVTSNPASPQPLTRTPNQQLGLGCPFQSRHPLKSECVCCTMLFL